MKKTLCILTASFLSCVILAGSFAGANKRANIFNKDVKYLYAYSSAYSDDESSDSMYSGLDSSDVTSNSDADGVSSNKPNKKPSDTVYNNPDKDLPPPIIEEDPGTVSDIENSINSKPNPPSSSTPPSSSESSTPEKPAVLTMKAVWISYFDVVASTNYKNEANFRTYIKAQLKKVKDKGLNTVFYQVRPYGDACYPSEYYPSSVSLKGADISFDAFKIVVNEAHALGLQCHAWINPYRTMSDAEYKLSSDCITKKWYNSSNRNDYMVNVSGRYWLKPGNKEVQELIKNGAVELLKNYNIDGLHIDDYFYAAALATYGDTKVQAQANTTAMVRSLYNVTHQIRSNAVFGVSPMGGFTNNSLGLPDSDRSNHATDLKLWCQNKGYIDYVMPQIYWTYDNAISPFTPVFNRWENFVDTSKVKLYVGLTSHTVPQCIPQQIKDVTASPKASGYALFSLRYIDIKLE